MLSDRGGLAVAELIFYIPVLILAIVVALRHGFGRQSGWIFLGILAVIRIVGSCCTLVAENSPSVGVITATLILQSIGLSPLLLAMQGMLKRIHEGMTNGRGVPSKVFNLLGTVLLVGLILGIVGGSQTADQSSTASSPNALTQAAIIIFFVMFVVQSCIAVFSLASYKSIIAGDNRILIAILLSIPFLLVRLIYSLLTVFAHNPDFNSLTGSVLIQGLMAVMEEFIVVILYLTAGLLAPKIQRSQVQYGEHSAVGENGKPQKESFQLMLPSQYIRQAINSRSRR